ncbi:MAG TPA: 30S ribosomal protein S7 [Phycisphaerae bacterium]|nr:30S ribosomal protein S7 [Phycisphaerae bacterium]HUU22474.1 30S ribosomal protein S7 [Phycisphaerae bacterium]
MAYKKWTASASQLAPDPRFDSKLVSKFVNNLMWDGKKAVAQRVFYDAMDLVEAKIKDTPSLEVFEQAIDNVKPMIEVRSKRVGGANYQVPMQVNSKRRLSLSIRWILQAVRAGKGQPTSQRLANELMAAFRKEGAAMSARENVHRMAEANKAFAHFAW